MFLRSPLQLDQHVWKGSGTRVYLAAGCSFCWILTPLTLPQIQIPLAEKHTRHFFKLTP